MSLLPLALLVLAVVAASSVSQALDVESSAERAESKKREAPPVLKCSPSKLRRHVSKGTPVSFEVQVRNDGGQTLKWSIKSKPFWLEASTERGEIVYGAQQILRLKVKPSYSDAGEEIADKLVIEAAGAKGSPKRISVWISFEPEVTQPVPTVEPVQEDGEPVPPSRERKSVEPGMDVDDLGVEPTRGHEDDRPGKQFGLRAGYMILGSADKRDFDPNASVGFFYQAPLKGAFSYEVGLDLAQADSANGDYTSQIFGGRLDVIWAIAHIGSRPYLLAGLEGIVESTDEKASGNTYTNYTAALNLGAGVALGKRVGLRATHSVFLDSSNIDGMTMLSVSYGF